MDDVQAARAPMAGSLTVRALSTQLDGSLRGEAVAGPFQPEAGTVPAGGQLKLTAGASVRFVNEAVLPSTGEARESLDLPVTLFSRDGFTRLSVTGSEVSVPAGVSVKTRPGGATSISGSKVDVAGTIEAPAGSISLESTRASEFQPYADTGVTIAPGARLSTRGLWINELPAYYSPDRTDPILIRGGDVSIASVSGVDLAPGSVIDASAGAWLQRDGTLRAGRPGSIRFSVFGFRVSPRLLPGYPCYFFQT